MTETLATTARRMGRAKAEAAALLACAWEDGPTRRITLILLAAAAAFIAANAVLGTLNRDFAVAAGPFREINLTVEGALPERYMQGLSLMTAILFVLAALDWRSRMTVFLAALYGFVWFDDTASYHERFGALLIDTLGLEPAFGLRALDFGELIAWALAGSMLGLAALWAVLRIRPGDVGIGVLVGLTFFALVAFAIAIDMLHIVVPLSLQGEVGVLEDGGEIVAISLTAGLAVALTRTQHRNRTACEAL